MIKAIVAFTITLMIPICKANELKLGMNVHFDKIDLPAEIVISYLKKYNINSIRVDYPWKFVERDKGKYQSASAKLDEFIYLAKKNDIESLIILDYGNSLYGPGRPTNAEQVMAFSNYAAWVARHFKNIHPSYEVWNEWSVQKNNNGEEALISSSTNYFNLVKATSEKIKEIDNTAVIIAGSFGVYSSWDINWARNLVELGVLRYVDGISIHPYNYRMKNIPSAEQSINDILSLREKAFYNKNVNLYITEYGFPNEGNSMKNINDIANYAKDYFYYASKQSSIKGIWWYQLVDESGSGLSSTFGLLTNKLNEKYVAQEFSHLK